MGQGTRKIRSVLGSFLAGVALLAATGTSFAVTPTVGADCDGASIDGTDTAGKVRVGANIGTCTLTFSSPWPKPPACTAMNEGNGSRGAAPVGTRSTTTTLVLDATSSRSASVNEDDVISYLCVGY